MGFMDNSSHITRALVVVAWVAYSPTCQLVVSRGACLGLVTNNVAKYNVVIKILSDSILNGILYLEFHLDSCLVVSLLNGEYRIHDPALLR